MASEPLVVQALYPFRGSNNDELCFKKGDNIIVTQRDENWWEGTLNGKTGWFPSNYVIECKDAPKPILNQQNHYKAVVLKDLIDSERAHVTELEGLVSNFLQPLEKSSILSSDEYKQLIGNIHDVVDMHRQLLNLIEAESSKPGPEQRVGRLFLTWASRIKLTHQIYCSLHPRAVCILDKYKDDLTKYMEGRGAASPGVLVLTTLLSKPFRRLDKYSGMLQELERHVEECHADRGDTQRSVTIYKDLATSCAATRRQKELELQVLTGPVRGWEGPGLSTLGEIIYMGSVAVGPQHHDRYFALFQSVLVFLSVSHRLSAFIYEGKLCLSSISVQRLEDSEQYKNAFEISTPMIEKKIVVCQSKDEANHWVELLSKQRSSNCSILNQRISPSQAQLVPQPPPHPDRTRRLKWPKIGAFMASSCGPPFPLAKEFSQRQRDLIETLIMKVPILCNRAGYKSILIKNYLFSKRRTIKKTPSINWYCATRSCKAEAWTTNDIQGNNATVTRCKNNHNHQPNLNSLKRILALQLCLKKAAEMPNVSSPEELLQAALSAKTLKNLTTLDVKCLKRNIERRISKMKNNEMSPLVATGSGQVRRNSRMGGASSASVTSTRSSPTPPAPPHGSTSNLRSWSGTNLRPTPPLRPCLALGTSPNGPYGRYSQKPMDYKEDGLILEVIEAYCSAGKPRSTASSVEVANGPKTNPTKSMQDILRLVQNELSVLDFKTRALQNELNEERQARCALQSILKKYLSANSKDSDAFEWPPMESNI